MPLMSYLDEIADPRRTVYAHRHDLQEMLVIAIYANQPTLLTTLQDRFALDQRDALRNATQCFEQFEESHGCLVIQRSRVSPNKGEVDTARWPNCKMLVTVESLRIVGGKPSDLERRYYISSRLLTTETFAKAVRGHWGIENRLHWMLDVNFSEDAATVRKDFAADNLTRLKKIVLNVLRLETATAVLGKLSLAKKRKLAAWDYSFRMAILGIKPIHDN